MSDLAISNAASLTAATLAGSDLVPILDVSAVVGLKGSQTTLDELGAYLVGNLNSTWNNAGTNFNLIYGRVTNTASGASSNFLDLGTVADGSLIKISKTGRLIITTNSLASDPAVCFGDSGQTGFFSRYDGHLFWGGTSRGVQFGIVPNGQIKLAYNGQIGWSAGAADLGGHDTFLSRYAAATLQMGETHATTPTTQIFKAHDVTTGTGADLVLAGGSGSVADGNVIISKLPTSNPGPGILWNNAGTPAIGT